MIKRNYIRRYQSHVYFTASGYGYGQLIQRLPPGNTIFTFNCYSKRRLNCCPDTCSAGSAITERFKIVDHRDCQGVDKTTACWELFGFLESPNKHFSKAETVRRYNSNRISIRQNESMNPDIVRFVLVEKQIFVPNYISY